MSPLEKFLEVESAGSNEMNSYGFNRCCHMPKDVELISILNQQCIRMFFAEWTCQYGLKALQGMHVDMCVWRVIYRPLKEIDEGCGPSQKYVIVYLNITHTISVFTIWSRLTLLLLPSLPPALSCFCWWTWEHLKG